MNAYVYDDFYKSLPKGRCNPCVFAKAVMANGGYMFLGCYYGDYHGKNVAEIKECPTQI